MTSPQPYPGLAEKIERARTLMQGCDLCEWRCRANRAAGEQGLCRLGSDATCYRELLHFGEEIELVPSHTIYLSGCNLRCCFCSDWEQVESTVHGRKADPAWLAERIMERRAEGARNVNFVGGEPAVNLLPILEALRLLPERVPVVWNSNMFMTPEVMEVLDGIVDIYLGDLKFGNDTCAFRLARVRHYCEVVQRNLVEAYRQARVIVRHLVMPGHLECCGKPCLEWLAQNLPEVRLSLLEHYQPTARVARDAVLGKRPDAVEIVETRRLARCLGLRTDGRIGFGNAAAVSSGAFQVRVTVAEDGEVVFHDLAAELVELAHEMDPDSEEVRELLSVTNVRQSAGGKAQSDPGSGKNRS